MGFYSQQELEHIGFKDLGRNVKLSRKASIYNPQAISIGDNTRIDDYSVISAGEGGIQIGCYVHIAVFCCLIGKGNIMVNDFANLSGRVSIYSSNDDYSGNYMTNPTINKNYTNVSSEPVLIGRHVIIGAGAVVLPGVILGEGASIGSLSLINKDCREFTIYAGVPARPLKERSRNLLKQEELFWQER
jgi:galactoside O-acetyltransferase